MGWIKRRVLSDGKARKGIRICVFLLCDNVAYDGFGEMITGYVFDDGRTDGWTERNLQAAYWSF